MLFALNRVVKYSLYLKEDEFKFFMYLLSPVSEEVVKLSFRGKTIHINTIMSKQRPSVDIGRCILCGGCLEVAPTVFRYNEAFGFVEVIELVEYPRRQVDEAIMLCPVTCIEWEEE